MIRVILSTADNPVGKVICLDGSRYKIVKHLEAMDYLQGGKGTTEMVIEHTNDRCTDPAHERAVRE